MVPDRLSYNEMYFDTFKYPSEWTEDWDQYVANRRSLCYAINQHMDNYHTRLPVLQKQTEVLHEQFFSATGLLNNIK
jgi:hypothetical protein